MIFRERGKGGERERTSQKCLKAKNPYSSKKSHSSKKSKGCSQSMLNKKENLEILLTLQSLFYIVHISIHTHTHSKQNLFNGKTILQDTKCCYFLISSLLYFFHYHLAPFYLFPPEITTLLSMSMSPYFCSIPPLPNLPPPAVLLLSIYESVPIFLVSSACSLDSTYG